MTIDTENLLNSIIASFDRMTYIRPEEIPDIALYMDQVTSFMDERLKATTRNHSEERIMTKTMINNYAKNDVIPPPVKKRYNKEHILILIMIYYFKSILQINDIKDLFDPIIEKFFEGNKEYGIEDVYKEIFSGKAEELENIKTDIIKSYDEAMGDFNGAPESEQDYLKLYSFVCKLSCDVFVKKLLIEKIVDSLKEHRIQTSDSKNKPKENKYDVSVDKKAKKSKEQ